MKLLNDINAPDYVFCLIIEWACLAKNDGYSFLPPGGLTRNVVVDLLFKSLPSTSLLCPSIQPVQHVDVFSSKVIVFDFVPWLLCLLPNPSVMTPEHLAIYFNDPLCAMKVPAMFLAKLCLAVYTVPRMSASSPTPLGSFLFLLSNGLIGLPVTGNDRFSLKPYMLKFKALGHRGFLPKCKNSSAQNQGKKLDVNICKPRQETRCQHLQLPR